MKFTTPRTIQEQERLARLNEKSRPTWEKMTVGAHTFYKMPLKEGIGATGTEEGYLLVSGESWNDGKLDFPADPAVEGFGPYISAGIARHTLGIDDSPRSLSMRRLENRPWVEGQWEQWAVDDDETKVDWPVHEPIELNSGPAKHVDAANLVIFTEMDWYGECFGVLEANGWTDYGEPTPELLKALVDAFADEGNHDFPEILEQGRKKLGEQYHIYVLDLAARMIAVPLSRIWYAASLMSLYYLHHDDLRFGYLWAEYRMRLRYEQAALKRFEQLVKNRESGMKGGRGNEKRERYAVLDRLANTYLKDFEFAGDKAAIDRAQQLAKEHDRDNGEEALFTVKGKFLRRAWFEEWLMQYREKMVARRQMQTSPTPPPRKAPRRSESAPRSVKPAASARTTGS